MQALGNLIDAELLLAAERLGDDGRAPVATLPVLPVLSAPVKPLVTALPLVPLKVMAVVPVRLVPAILIVVPTGPLVAARLLRAGPAWRSPDTVLPPTLATARSGLPSPSTSPMRTEMGPAPVPTSALGAKLTAPAVEVLRNTHTVSLLTLATAR